MGFLHHAVERFYAYWNTPPEIRRACEDCRSEALGVARDLLANVKDWPEDFPSRSAVYRNLSLLTREPPNRELDMLRLGLDSHLWTQICTQVDGTAEYRRYAGLVADMLDEQSLIADCKDLAMSH